MNRQDRITYFIDLDGTLFDQNKKSRISDKNLSAILVLKNFCNIVLSTGRSFVDQRVQQAMFSLDINDIITASGAETYINGKLFSQTIMSKDLIDKIVKFARERKIMVVLFDSNGETIYVNNIIEYYINRFFLSRKLYAIKFNRRYDYHKHSNIIKAAFILKNPKSCKKVLKSFNDEFSNLTNATAASGNYVIEITDIKADKAIATVEYMKYKKIKKENTVHIGDSMSDSILKGHIGKLVAMGNSVSELKEVADEIAPNYKNGGLFKYFISKKKEDKDD